MKGKPAIIISILFGILAWVFMYLYLNTQRRELLQIADVRTGVVATVDILAGTPIEENMIAEREFPAAFLDPSAFTSARDVVGQIPAVPIQSGSQIRGTSMTSAGRSLATKIPRGRRAVSLAVTDVSGVSSLVRPGNMVDVVAIVKLGSSLGSSDQRTFVTTILQNVLVLAVGQDTGDVQPTSGDPDEIALLAAQEERFSTVTLALTPTEVQDLVLAQDVGDLSLSLRSFREGEETLELGRSNPARVFGVEDSQLVPRRAPSWQEIRGSSR